MNRHPGDRLEDLERQEARLDFIERKVKQGFYLVLVCALGAGLGVSPLNQIPGVWASGMTVVISAVYLAVIWWRHQRALAVIRARAAAGPHPRNGAL